MRCFRLASSSRGGAGRSVRGSVSRRYPSCSVCPGLTRNVTSPPVGQTWTDPGRPWCLPCQGRRTAQTHHSDSRAQLAAARTCAVPAKYAAPNLPRYPQPAGMAASSLTASCRVSRDFRF